MHLKKPNFPLLLGHFLHLFDYKRIAKSQIYRNWPMQKGEVELKDGQLVTLDPEKALVYKGVVLEDSISQ